MSQSDCDSGCGLIAAVGAGSDLIFAWEGIAPLVKSYEYFAGPDCVCYLIAIRRFEWEDSFFKGMSTHFSQKVVRATALCAFSLPCLPAP